jgi:HlyD family secretion protein
MRINEMKRKASYSLQILLIILLLLSCNQNGKEFDASGVFESDEIIISSESAGVIREFKIEEGMELDSGTYIGFIDTTQLHLKISQIEAQIRAINSKKPDIIKQLASMEEQLNFLNREKIRIKNLLEAGAATQKQLDDISSNIEVLSKQIEAVKSNLEITSKSIDLETAPLNIQIKQLNDQINKSIIINPVKGTVLTKFAYENELANVGKPLYKISDLSFITLRAYVTGEQLDKIKLNQSIYVFVDNDKDNYKKYTGKVEWISRKAEFTPKTIQTKDERANLVYAIKIRVKNDGFIKIGMYAEVKFSE